MENVNDNLLLKLFSTNLKLAMVQQNKISNTQLANKIGVSRQIIGKWLNCECAPSIVQLNKLAIVLNVSTDYLLSTNLLRGKDDLSKSEDCYERLKATGIAPIMFTQLSRYEENLRKHNETINQIKKLYSEDKNKNKKKIKKLLTNAFQHRAFANNYLLQAHKLLDFAYSVEEQKANKLEADKLYLQIEKEIIENDK